MLQRNPSQKEPSGPRPEDQDERENAQGSEKDSSEQEEIIFTGNDSQNHVDGTIFSVTGFALRKKVG